MVFISVTNDLVADQRVHKIALSLIKFGNEVTLIGRLRKNSLPINQRPYKTKRLKLFFDRGIMFYAEYNFHLFFYLLFKKFDILLSNDLDTLPANYLLSVIRNKTLVYDSHEYFTQVPELINRKFVQKTWLLIERLILPRIKYSYTVCKSIAKIYSEKYGIDMKVIRNVPICNRLRNNPIDTKKNTIQPSKFVFPSNKKIILYQGSVNIGRGIDYMIKAMKHITDAVFVVIGNGDILSDMQKLVKQSGLENKVIFTGRIPFEKLIFYTVRADIGISLEENTGENYYYALPNKLFDYIQANVPVIASPLPEIRKIVEGYNIGVIIEKHDPKHIAETIKLMFDNCNQSAWKKNLTIAAEELCWEKEEKILFEIFSEI
jgi:glycosyltransferase involved in cell wall biosynthesis